LAARPGRPKEREAQAQTPTRMPADRPRHRQAAWAAVLLAGGLSCAGAAFYAQHRADAAEQAALATAERAARAGRAAVTPMLEAALEALAAVEARQAALLRGDRPGQAAAERQIAQALRRDGLQFAAVTDAAGRISWATHAPLSGAALGDREAFALHRAGRAEPLLAPALLDLPGGPRSLLLSRPATDAREAFAGILLVALDPRRLERLLGDATLLPGQRLALLRADGTPLGGAGPLATLPWPLPRAERPDMLPARGAEPPLALASLPLAGTDVRMLALLDDAAGRDAAREAGLLAFALAIAASLALALLPLALRRQPAGPAAATPGLDEAIPAVGYRGQVEPGGPLRLTQIGPGVERLTGWTPEAALRPGWRQRGMDAATLPLGPDLPDRLRHAPEASTEYRFRRADGSWMWLRETARVVGRGPEGAEVVGALEDISAERELALQAAAAAKFATLGEMAAGLAHELNQPIAIMSLAAENAAEALESGEPGIEDARARLRRIMSQAERAKAIVTQLRAFSRVDVGTLEPVDIGAAVQGLMVLAGQALRDAHVQVQIRLPDALPPVVGQAVLVEQVLLNLALNARDALMDHPAERRRLRIEAEPGPGAEEVCLRVTDSGPGIAPEVMQRLFEPFYTTKPPGQGTGLGLSICRTIMRGLGGRIEAANGAEGSGQGAAFTLVFRRAVPAAPLPEFAPEPAEAAPTPRWPAAT
jgi:signal transduction histidine kinase